MAFGKKKKTEADEWDSDSTAQPESGNRRVRRPALTSGYGVADSYSRQSSYGGAQSWYPEESTQAGSADSVGAGGAGTANGSGHSAGYGTATYGTGTGGDAAADTAGNPHADGRSRSTSAGVISGNPETSEASGEADRETETAGGKAPRRRSEKEQQRSAGSGVREREETPEERRRRLEEEMQKQKKRHTGRVIIELVLLLVLAVGLFGFWRLSRMDRVKLTDILKNDGVTTASGYMNFVVYGVDSREGNLTKDAHSDTIIICSLNQSTNEIKMVSVYRDTYLDNTNGEYRKATECYFFGGPERSINMLNKNLDLDIEDYVSVDFNAVIDAVDLIGGVDIEVTEEELPYINGYQEENSAVTGAEITPVESAGYQHLNGIQALAYCRIRYTAGYDYKRTERQRAVLTQIFEKAKAMGVTTLLQLVDQLLPEISTSFSNTELISLASGISNYTLGENTGFPFELQAANISAGDCVIPVNLAQNVSELHAFLFGTENYTPSQTVQEISAQIIADTGIG